MNKLQIIIGLRSAAVHFSFGGRLLLSQRILRRVFRHIHGVVEVDDFDGSMKVSLSLSDHMQRRIFWMGYYNREMVFLLDKLMKPGMVFIDVGSNIGEIALVAAKRTGVKGRVICFEPVDKIAKELEYNISRNNIINTEVVRMGLSDVVSQVPIFRSCGQGDPGDEHSGLGSLYGNSDTDDIIQMIDVTTLDNYLSEKPIAQIDIIKIDIEGAELPCIKGAEQTLRRHRPLLIIEIQEKSSVAAGYRQKDILEYLAGLGYVFKKIGPGGRLRDLSAQALEKYQNVLCIPAQHHTSQG